MRYNFSFKNKEKKRMNTIVPLPDWYRTSEERVLRVIRPKIVAIRVRYMSKIGDYNEEFLLNSNIFDEPATLNTEEIKRVMDGKMPLKWMKDFAPYTAIQNARRREYSRTSILDVSSGDGWPGVSLGDMSFERIKASTVNAKGGADVILGDKRYFVPSDKTETIIERDFIGFARTGERYGVQWNGYLGALREMACNIKESVAFTRFYEDLVPQFTTVFGNRPALLNLQSLIMRTDKPQTFKFRYRNVEDYTDIFSEIDLEMPESGQIAVNTLLVGSPFVPPVVAEIDALDKTTNPITDRLDSTWPPSPIC